MDDASFESQVPDDELEAMRRELARLGEQPLPPGVATRLEARLAAELDSTPLAARRSRRHRLRLGASLSAAAAVAAAVVVLVLSSRGGAPPPVPEAAAPTATVAAAAADSAAKTAIGAAAVSPARKKCAPASRTGGGRPRAACPGARGGHARAV